MEKRKSRKARLVVESLERRDTPGSLAGGGELAAVADLAARSAIRAAATTSTFRGNGRVTITRQTPLSNGRLQVVGNLTGAATVMGTFKGASATVFSSGLRTFRSTTILQATDGSRITMSIVGSRGAGNSARGTYTITGGTRRFLGATGTGVVTGTLSLATNTLTFNFNGKIRRR